MKLLTAFLFLAVTISCGQTTLVSPLPVHCKAGDLMDGYDGASKCVATDKWEKIATMSNCDQDTEHTGANVGVIDSLPWSPSCSWAFQDKADKWHCPYETASGRVVACKPCSGKFAADQGCQKYFNRCQRRIAIMKSMETAEASTYEASTYDVPKDEQTDHTQSRGYHFKCPTGFSKDWLGEHDEYESPICVRKP